MHTLTYLLFRSIEYYIFRCVEEGRGAQLPTPHSPSELAFIGEDFLHKK